MPARFASRVGARAKQAAGSVARRASAATAARPTAGASSGGRGWKGKAMIGGGVGVGGVMGARSLGTGSPSDKGLQSLYGLPTNRGQFY